MTDTVCILLIFAYLAATFGLIRLCDLLTPREQRSTK